MAQHDSSSPRISPFIAGMLGGAAALVALVLTDEKKRKKIKDFFADLKQSGESMKDTAQKNIEKLTEMGKDLSESLQEEEDSPKKGETKNEMKRILIVDDDEAILEVIEIILKERGYDVAVVADGSNVYRLIEAHHPHLILLDIWMAGIDGSKIAQSLKHNPQTQTIPILMISANNEGAELAMQSGADGFLAKPFELEELLTRVEYYLSPESTRSAVITNLSE